MKRILIYDNEPAQSSELAAILRRLCTDAVVLEANDLTRARELIQEGCYAVFLDIELENGMNGIEVSKTLRRTHPDASLIFVTAHTRYCEEIFESSPDAMLVKPFSEESVKRALAIVARKRSDSGTITLSTGKSSAKTIGLDGISYIESALRKITVYDLACRETGVFRDIKLSELIERLPDSFVWCHQSFIVSLACVRGISRYMLTLEGGTTIPVSQSRFKEVRRRYFEFVGDAL